MISSVILFFLGLCSSPEIDHPCFCGFPCLFPKKQGKKDPRKRHNDPVALVCNSNFIIIPARMANKLLPPASLLLLIAGAGAP